MVKRKIEMITNDNEIKNKGISYKKSLFIIIIFILFLLFILSTSLELKEERVQMLVNTFLIILIVFLLVVYISF